MGRGLHYKGAKEVDLLHMYKDFSNTIRFHSQSPILTLVSLLIYAIPANMANKGSSILGLGMQKRRANEKCV